MNKQIIDKCECGCKIGNFFTCKPNSSTCKPNPSRRIMKVKIRRTKNEQTND